MKFRIIQSTGEVMRKRGRRYQQGFHDGYQQGGRDALVIAVIVSRELGQGGLSTEYLQEWLHRATEVRS